MEKLRSTPRRRQVAGNDLTGRELQIARLRASGLISKEIAIELSIALSTVEEHLRNIHGKLKIKRRDQIASRLHALYLAPAHFGCRIKRSYAKHKTELILHTKAS